MILVTGASGFVGSHLVRHLLRQGKPVRALVRSTERAQRWGEMASQAEVVTCRDITDMPALYEACQGVDTVIHLVAIIRERGPRTFQRVNHQGTLAIVTAAQERGVRNFVHLSAIGAAPQERRPYLLSKWQGEEAVRQSGLQWVILRASIIFGAEDEFVNTLAGVVKAMPLVPILGDGKTPFQPIWVEDVARCLETATTSPELVRQTVAIGGPEHLTYEEAVDLIIATLGVRRAKLHLPLPLMRPFVRLRELLPRTPVTSHQLQMLALDNTTALDSVPRYFGFQPTSLREKIGYVRGAPLRL